MSYTSDVKLLRRLPVQDPELRFSSSQAHQETVAAAEATV